MGALCTEKGQYDEAYKALKVSQCLSPQSPGVYFYLGELELKREQYDEARGYYEQSMLLQPNQGTVYQRLGEVYEKLQLRERAAEAQERKKTLGGPLFIIIPPRYGQGCRPLW
jgi:tetratricopeptide (TPR) repeat protein